MSSWNSSQRFRLLLLFFSIFTAFFFPGALAQAASPMHPDGVDQSAGGNETQEKKSPDTTKSSKASSNDSPKIQDNSFLVEEAYNQEFGVSTTSSDWSAASVLNTTVQPSA